MGEGKKRREGRMERERKGKDRDPRGDTHIGGTRLRH